MHIERLKSFVDSLKTPCIFSSGIEHWPAFSKWSPQFFQKKFTNLKVVVNYNLPENGCPYLHQEAQYLKNMSLEEFIDFMTQNDRCYIAQQDIQKFCGLDLDYNFLDIIPKSQQNKEIFTNLWIGKNTRSGLHFDYTDNFLVQIYGIKKVFLVAPEENRYLYPLSENFTKTQMNPLEPDFIRFPKFKKATVFEGEIAPGEVLFIPKGWFHYIYAPNESISLNCWYGDELDAKAFLLSFYRSGWRVWVSFIKDFVWHGLLKRPMSNMLFCSPPLGKLAYDGFVKKLSA